MDDFSSINPGTLVLIGIFLLLSVGRLFIKHEELELAQASADVQREISYYKLADTNAERLARMEVRYYDLEKRYDDLELRHTETARSHDGLVTALEDKDREVQQLKQESGHLKERVKHLEDENEQLRREIDELKKEKGSA